MGFILDDKRYINDNIFKFEQRLGSQYGIFTEKNPTFVTYYHINNINSITDTGLLNVDRILGNESPLRFQKILDLPIYGIDQIKLDLNDEDEGLNATFESDGIILPNTIHPLPNDFFTISYLDDSYLFMITQIDYDTIKSNNYYKINFMLRANDPQYLEYLNDQTLEKYNCIFKNIGTNDNCLIIEDTFNVLRAIDEVYASFLSKYVSLFYNKRYNSFMFNNISEVIYDKFLTEFMNTHNLLNEKEKYKTFVLTNEDYGEQFPITYELSLYDIIENKKINDLNHIRYELCPVTYPHSIFLYYNLTNVRSLVFIPEQAGYKEYLPDTLIDSIKSNTIDQNNNILEELLIKYFNNSIESINQINTTKLKDYRIRYDLNNFILIPIILFILRTYSEKFLET